MKVDLIFIVAMIVPFAFQTVYSYLYWIVIATVYLVYKAWRWKV